MTSALVFWFALVHAFSVATAPAPAWDRADASATRTQPAQLSAQIEAESGPVDVPARVTVVGALRNSLPAPVGKRDAAALLNGNAPHRSLALATRRILQAHGSETHRIESRGHVLPYFPTAPPRRA